MQYSLQLCDCCMYLCIQFLSKFVFHRLALKNEMEMQKQKNSLCSCVMILYLRTLGQICTAIEFSPILFTLRLRFFSFL